MLSSEHSRDDCNYNHLHKTYTRANQYMLTPQQTALTGLRELQKCRAGGGGGVGDLAQW